MAIYLERLPDVIERTGLSRSSIYSLMGQGKFPQSIKLSERCIAWNREKVDEWILDRIEASQETKGVD